MQLLKLHNQYGFDIKLKEDRKSVTFSYAGNLDLYWSFKSKDVSIDNTFEITKENYELYKLFYQLFKDIEEINIYDEDDIPVYYMDEELEKEDYLEGRRQRAEETRSLCRLNNYANYNDLYNPDNNTITWYSDETAPEVANYLVIKKEDDKFLLEFNIQSDLEGYDSDFKSNRYIPIRFRNSGSNYDPFNFVFMRMYRNMANLDDVNDIGHQVLLEEYLYDKVKRLTK